MYQRPSKRIARPWVVRIWYRSHGDDVLSVDSDYLTRPEAEALEGRMLDDALFAKAFEIGAREAALADLESYKDVFVENPGAHYGRKFKKEREKALWGGRWRGKRIPSALAGEIKGARHLTLPHQIEGYV